HQKRKAELEAQAPGDDSRLDRFTIVGKEKTDGEYGNQTNEAREPLHCALAYYFEDQSSFFGCCGGNAEGVFDHLRGLFDVFFAGVVEPAKNATRVYFLADLDFEYDADSRIDAVFLRIASGADHSGGHSDIFGIDGADVSGARRGDFAGSRGVGKQIETVKHA